MGGGGRSASVSATATATVPPPLPKHQFLWKTSAVASCKLKPKQVGTQMGQQGPKGVKI